MNDLMIDTETMGLGKRATIATIGAIFWNPTTGEMGPSFYRVINMETCNKSEIESDALYWWLEQSDAARQALVIPGKVSITEALTSFSGFVNQFGNAKTVRYWSNGANFDNALLEEAYNLYGLTCPFAYWNSRDVRTVLGFYPPNLFKDWKINNPRKGAHHNALDDAKYQAKYVSMVLKELGVENLW